LLRIARPLSGCSSHPEVVPLGCSDLFYDDQTVTHAVGNYQFKYALTRLVIKKSGIVMETIPDF
jgi:hypothetical protein